MSSHSDFIDSWRIHDRINRYLLDSINENALGGKPPKGRTARAQFVHMHNVRLMWLKSAAPELLDGLTKLEPDASREQVAQELSKSGQAVSILLERSFADGKVKGFKPHPAAFLAYLISHESHHRRQVEINLRAIGMPISDKASFGLWEWGSRAAE